MERVKLLALVLAVAVAVELAVIIGLYIELEGYKRAVIDLKISEVYIPVNDGKDVHMIRVALMNLGFERVDELEVRLKWMRKGERIYEDIIVVRNIAPKTFYSYTYTFTFEGAADRIIYSYNGVTKTATHGQ